jgi:hypothetical protein
MVKLSATVQWNVGREQFQLIIRQEDANGSKFQRMVDWLSTDLDVVRTLRKWNVPQDEVKVLNVV